MLAKSTKRSDPPRKDFTRRTQQVVDADADAHRAREICLMASGCAGAAGGHASTPPADHCFGRLTEGTQVLAQGAVPSRAQQRTLVRRGRMILPGKRGPLWLRRRIHHGENRGTSVDPSRPALRDCLPGFVPWPTRHCVPPPPTRRYYAPFSVINMSLADSRRSAISG